MSDRLVVDRQGGVADVRLNRADKLNALDPAMFKALISTGEELAEDRSLRAIVLSGEGRAFCAGLDFASFAALSSSDGDAPNMFHRTERSLANFAQRAAWVWTEIPVPVIAAVHGVAYGGGLQIALGADIRFVTPDARLSVREIQWGLIPDMSGTQTLRHLVRQDLAKELTYTGRIVPGSEAVEIGLASHLSDTPREAAHELAREIAGRSPDAVRSAKRLLNQAPVLGLREGLQLEEECQRSLLGGPNQVEAVRSNMEKREPRFQDPE